MDRPGKASAFAIEPPIEPMLAKLADAIPEGDYLYEPKWDGFRAIVFRSASDVYIQSRDSRPFDRYFPDLHEVFLARLPAGCVLDGEIVIAAKKGLDFDALQMRLHPAASRVARLAKEMPASFVAFDALASRGKTLLQRSQRERRAELETFLAKVEAPIHVTPATLDRSAALRWLKDFEGAGLDGVVAKPLGLPYQPGKRAMLKIKHARTAECVVVGFRWHKQGEGIVGSLLLGLYDDAGTLHHVGVTSSFDMATRRQLAKELEPLRTGVAMPGEQSRWSVGRDTTWHELRPERVCEVKYDHLQGDRFRHAAIFLRWRPDKRPRDCRYDQLEVTRPYALKKIFSL
ncbi:MAG: ATP-dependent DNA ligase [Clostridia bacterium]